MRMCVPILFILYSQAQILAQSPDLYKLYQTRHTKIKIFKPEYDQISSYTSHLNSRSIFDSLIRSTPAHSWNCCHAVCHSTERTVGCWHLLQRYLILRQIMCLCPIGQMWFSCAKIIQIIMKKILFLIAAYVRIIF